MLKYCLQQYIQLSVTFVNLFFYSFFSFKKRIKKKQTFTSKHDSAVKAAEEVKKKKKNEKE